MREKYEVVHNCFLPPFNRQRTIEFGRGGVGYKRMNRFRAALQDALDTRNFAPDHRRQIKRILASAKASNTSPFSVYVYEKEWPALSKALRPGGSSPALYSWLMKHWS